jgi:hypothetical protein
MLKRMQKVPNEIRKESFSKARPEAFQEAREGGWEGKKKEEGRSSRISKLQVCIYRH